MIAALLMAGGPAVAHGPAPTVLEVLTWEAAGCPVVPADLTPGLVRTNVGILRHVGDGTYSYGCPSRWGDAEVALAAASPDGAELLLAGSGGIFRSTDGGCTAVDLGIGLNETPVVLRWSDGGFWLVTRDFGPGLATLWRVEGGWPAVAWAGDELLPDGLLPDAGGLWLAGANPMASLSWFDGESLHDRTPSWPDVDARIDRLTPRLVEGGGLWLLAGAALDRRLWWTDGLVVEGELGPGESVHGPVRVGGALVAAVDGVAWTRAEDWVAGPAVDWTCLQQAGEVPVACGLGRARVLRTADLDVDVVMTLDQLGPPDEACPDPELSCELDWLHFGGEAGWTVTDPASCPDGERTPIVEEEELEPTEAAPCSCAGHLGGGWWLGALSGAAWRRRRRGRTIGSPRRMRGRSEPQDQPQRR